MFIYFKYNMSCASITILFLKEEYWAPELLAMEKLYIIEEDILEGKEELDNTQAFKDLIELWTSVGLYIHAGYQLVSDLPDTELQYVFLLQSEQVFLL